MANVALRKSLYAARLQDHIGKLKEAAEVGSPAGALCALVSQPVPRRRNALWPSKPRQPRRSASRSRPPWPT